MTTLVGSVQTHYREGESIGPLPPNFCGVCGKHLFVEARTVGYDRVTGDPVLQDMMFCSTAWTHAGSGQLTRRADEGDHDSWKKASGVWYARGRE